MERGWLLGASVVCLVGDGEEGAGERVFQVFKGGGGSCGGLAVAMDEFRRLWPRLDFLSVWPEMVRKEI